MIRESNKRTQESQGPTLATVSLLQRWPLESMDCIFSVLPDQIPLQLDREGIKERDDERGGEGVIILGKRSFQYLHQRRAIIRGMAILRGNTVIYAGPLIM